MKARVSQRDLGKLAGVSAMTVSLALRGHPSIPAATRKRIQALARQHNYHPDPALSVLNAYRRQSAKRTFQGTLAWVTAFEERAGWRRMPQAEGYFEGVVRSASDLGYQVDEFWANEPGQSGRRLTEILQTRGIRGLIVAPLPRPGMTLALDWSAFTAVALGYSLGAPRLHVVMNHQFRNMLQLVVCLHGRGYRRIGLALPEESDKRIGHTYLGGYLAGVRAVQADELPIFSRKRFSSAELRAWYCCHKPEAIIVSQDRLSDLRSWLDSEKLRVPQDVGLAVPCLPFGNRSLAGMDEDPPAIGSLAVNTVVSHLHRNERGIPERPISILVDAVWNAGRTVRSRLLV